MNIRERLIEYIEEKGIKVAEFERKIGIARGYTYSKSSLGSDILARIKEEYPDIDLDWLLTGEDKIRIVDRMKEYIRTKGQSVEEVDKELWGTDFIKKILRIPPQAHFFAHYEKHPKEDVNIRAVNYFVKKYAKDLDPIWLITGEGSMLKAEEKCSNCEE